MPQSIPPGLKRQHVLQALADLDAGVAHPFGEPTGYELLNEGKRYAPKAVVGLACRALLGRILRPEDFSGGEAPGQANFVLRKLGFQVMKKGDAPGGEEERGLAGKDWGAQEVKLLVADYFAMLEAELVGKPYTKATHRKALEAQLAGRSKGSIEFKHQNVSGVLVELGLPYIDGYKPRGNYQGLLATEVEEFLDRRPDFLAQLAEAPRLNPQSLPSAAASDLERVMEEPPERIPAAGPAGKPWLSRRGQRIDFAQRDAANRLLGKLGEEFVLRLERGRLKASGRDDLAARLVWASRELGDGLGFDILSFDEGDESERLLEVKTTGLGKFFPFCVYATEVRCSEDVPAQFELHRVFDFGQAPRLYVLHGALTELCRLEPLSYRASW